MTKSRADVVIVGAGFSGALAATVLGRNGYNVTLIDRYERYPDEFRAEQLVGYPLVGALQRLGVFEALVEGLPLVPRAVGGRRGKIVGGLETPHYGLSYSSMIARLRGQIPAGVKRTLGKVVAVEPDPRQTRIVLDDGCEISAPLVVLATGMNAALLTGLRVNRRMVSPGHSLAIAFDIEVPKLGNGRVGTYFGGTNNRIDYITVFPFNGRQRANLFMYAQPADQQVRNLQVDPATTLRALMPQFETVLGDFTITSRPVKRLNDILVSDPELDGVVLIGDAFQTPCPSTGTGISRLINDVEVLCNTYIPEWLEAGRTGSACLTEFYRDQSKLKIDREALHTAKYRRAVTTRTSLRWRAHRTRLEIMEAVRYGSTCQY
jgi:2-polyprenyl-6-methoxyphenol hydroxylase-like FAD-dependent oxidoreductase